MIALQNEPTGETYKKLIEYALRKSDAFSLVFCNYHSSRDYEKKIETLRDEMRKFLLKSRSDPIWPGTVSYDTRHKYIIDIYCASKSLLNFLVAPERLFGWNYPDAAEDIAFFKNGKCWFSTCSHEKIGLIHFQEKEDIDMLQMLGIDYRIHPDTTPFMEDYSLAQNQRL